MTIVAVSTGAAAVSVAVSTGAAGADQASFEDEAPLPPQAESRLSFQLPPLVQRPCPSFQLSHDALSL